MEWGKSWGTMTGRTQSHKTNELIAGSLCRIAIAGQIVLSRCFSHALSLYYPINVRVFRTFASKMITTLIPIMPLSFVAERLKFPVSLCFLFLKMFPSL